MSGQIRERTRFLRDWRRLTPGSALPRLSGPQQSLAVTFVAAAFMAIAGPFGTWREPLIERLGFWLIGLGGCTISGRFLDRWLQGITSLRHRPMARLSLSVAVTIAPAALIASVAAALIHRTPVNWQVYLQTLPEIGLVGAGFCALMLLSFRANTPGEVFQRKPDPTLGGLLPLKLSGATLFAIEAQDHYVRVHTDRGTDLVLMNFETAISKPSLLEGSRTHRSWWVARSAIISATRGDGRATLSLRTGQEVPVSRRYSRGLREAGWY